MYGKYSDRSFIVIDYQKKKGIKVKYNPLKLAL